jgi:uridine kinase
MFFEDLHQLLLNKSELASLDVAVIGVSGQFGAGKTELCKGFAEYLCEEGDVHSISLQLDRYFQLNRAGRYAILEKLDSEGADDMAKAEAYAINQNLVMTHLDMLKRREAIHAKNLYQRLTGEKDLDFDIDIGDIDKPVWIIIDGVFLLHSPMRDKMDGIIIIEADKPVRMERGIGRAKQQNPYTSRCLDEVEGIVNFYLQRNNNPQNIRIDNTDYNNRKFILKI